MRKADNEGLKTKTMHGFLWMLSGSGIQSVMQFFVLISLARLLDAETFGIIGAAFVVISFSKILATIGLGPALVQKKTISKEHVDTSFTFSIVLSVCLSIMLFVFSSTIADSFQIDRLQPVLQVMSAMLIFEGVAKVSESLIQRELKFHLLVRIQVISYVFYGMTGTILALSGFNVWALVFAHLIQTLIRTLLALHLQPYKYRFEFHFQALNELFYFSGGYSLTKISTELSDEGDNLMIGRFLGADSLGLYSRAYQLMITPANLLGNVLSQVLFPVASQLQDNRDKMAYLYTEGTRLALTLMFPFSLFIAIHADKIVLLLFGEQWLGLVGPFQVLALSLFFRSSDNISHTIAKAKGAVYYRAMISWIYAFMVLSFTFIGQFLGLTGAATGVSLAVFLNYIFSLILAVRLTHTKTWQLLRVHAGGITMAALVWIGSISTNYLLLPWVDHFIAQLLIDIMVFVLIYLVCLLSSPQFFIGMEGKRLVHRLQQKMSRRKRP
ncbi:lipopolysaccharide biosynthesis protein [Lentibacillus kapialis]|uniref:Lipopolysaccharide biosynthesis protein n=1 Tax=Lentibacillus kapialis TaxID=340214 RepID=A0A917Q1J5_9BACI|nr:lipopolysaccharide biosynthesis protein [Lentibacillus kapialis]GGK05806.1 lipopolysaccharide biosynthesis protein [Lentibacillus kapialis]